MFSASDTHKTKRFFYIRGNINNKKARRVILNPNKIEFKAKTSHGNTGCYIVWTKKKLKKKA